MSEHGTLIYSVCRYRLSPSFDFAVEDAAAETALRLYRAIERQVLGGQPVHCNRTFVRLVATRTAITVFNKHVREVEQQRRLVNELAVSEPQYSSWAAPSFQQVTLVADLDDTELSLLLEQLPKLINTLCVRDQSLLRLYYLTKNQPLTWDVIGERLDMQAAAARQAGRRALKKLSTLAHATLNEIRRGDT
jgi:RNA polymerase sigma factor (sigma-70 family)